MKKHFLKSLAAISLVVPVFSASAAVYNVGTYHLIPANPDGDYSIETSGVFYDEYDFYLRSYNWRDSGSVTFSGFFSNMYNDELRLIDLNSRTTYSLDQEFNITIDNLRYNQRFAITGAGLNATDPTVISSYNLSLDVELNPYTPSPNPVPLPATAWLFVSGLMGFATFRRKRKSVSLQNGLDRVT